LFGFSGAKEHRLGPFCESARLQEPVIVFRDIFPAYWLKLVWHIQLVNQSDTNFDA
jgi:hypothetical protein